MDLQDTIVLRIKRERGIYLDTNYGPMEVVNPSVMVSRLDMVVLDSTAAGIDFRRLPQGFWNIGVFIEQRGGPGAPEVGTTHQGMPGPPGTPSWVVLPLENPSKHNLGPLGVFWSIKNLRKVPLHLDSVWY